MKQRQAAAENLRKTDIQTLNVSVKSLHDEITNFKQTVQENLVDLKNYTSKVECASQQKLNQYNTYVSSNSKTIIDLQQSLLNVHATLSEINNRLEDSVATIPHIHEVELPVIPHMVDAATQCDGPLTEVRENQTPVCYSQAIAANCDNSQRAENLIDLETNVNSSPITYTARILNPPIDIENTEDASCFGNSKIPTSTSWRTA